MATEMDFGEILTMVSIGVTIFVVWKLYGTLGQRTGHQAPPPHNVTKRQNSDEIKQPANGDNVIDMPGIGSGKPGNDNEHSAMETYLKPYASPDSDLFNSLKSVLETDRNFNPEEFLKGARMAYEMIVTAFNDGDAKTLKNLLAKDVFDGFSSAISERTAKGERMNFSFVGINDAKIVDAEVTRSEVFVSVRFNSQIISAMLNSKDEVVDGDLEEIADVTDIWTFSRDSRSRDPNWKLVATESVQ